jgi:hypothetical protein
VQHRQQQAVSSCDAQAPAAWCASPAFLSHTRARATPHRCHTNAQGDLGLNIREAHVFNTTDGFALDVFVVDGFNSEVRVGARGSLVTAAAAAAGFACARQPRVDATAVLLTAAGIGVSCACVCVVAAGRGRVCCHVRGVLLG